MLGPSAQCDNRPSLYSNKDFPKVFGIAEVESKISVGYLSIFLNHLFEFYLVVAMYTLNTTIIILT